MDNYLAKPIVADELFAALGQTDDKSDERRTPPRARQRPSVYARHSNDAKWTASCSLH